MKGEMEIIPPVRGNVSTSGMDGGLNKQLVIRPPHIYGNKGSFLEEACSTGTSVWLLSSAAAKFDSVHDFKA